MDFVCDALPSEAEFKMPAIAPSKMPLPLAREVQAAVQGQRALVAYLSTQVQTQHIQILDARSQAHQIELPTSALRLLLDILAELSEGNAVKEVPVHAELTTQEAADMLHVSRPHLVKLLEEGQLAFHRTGKHRRVRFADWMAFKERRDKRQSGRDAGPCRASPGIGNGLRMRHSPFTVVYDACALYPAPLRDF